LDVDSPYSARSRPSAPAGVGVLLKSVPRTLAFGFDATSGDHSTAQRTMILRPSPLISFAISNRYVNVRPAFVAELSG
jgi:hypothetical protein